MTSMIPTTGFMSFLLLLLFSGPVLAQYRQTQFGSASSGGSFQQSGSSFQQSGGGFNSQSRFQSHVPPPGIPQLGGQYREQRIINVQENIQGTAQGGGGYGYGSWGAGGASGSGSSYQYNQNGYGLDTSSITAIKGSQVDLKLISYSNSGLTLSNTTTCKCPISNCNYIPENQQNQCYFSFVIVISAADQSIQYIQSNFYPMPSSGIINTGNWTNQYTFLMNTKPVSIDIFVQHLGVVIDSSSAQLLFFNHLTLVDSFVVDLLSFNSNGQSGTQTLTLGGQQQSTSLQMSLNVQCINSMMGPYCDLSCPTTTTGSTVICFSNRTDTYSSCKWNTYKTQVTDCVVCTHGATNGTCNGAYIAYDGVSYAFRTWTIVLGCLLGIALLLILCLILSYIICYRIRNRGEVNTYDERKIDASSSQALISKDEWSSSQDAYASHRATSRKPVGILSNKRVQQVQQQDEAGSEDSYRATGVQQTTITTTKTSKREHVV